MQTPASDARPVGATVRRLGRAARGIAALAALILLVGWGVFAVTTTVPNPNDQANVYGAFQSIHPFQWYPEKYNLAPGSTIDFVFNINYVPNGAGGCNGYLPVTSAKNGTWAAECSLPRPNSTFTSTVRDYLTFTVQPDRGCCQQSYFSWVSGPSGNLTGFSSAGGFFEIDQEGNYSLHISNTNFLPPPAYPVGYVNGTLTYSDGFLLFTRPYFSAGIATLAVAIIVAVLFLYSTVSQRRSRR